MVRLTPLPRLTIALAALVTVPAPICAGQPAPLTSASAPTVVSIWGGARHCVVLLSDGTVWDWGYNWSGKLGDGTATISG